MWPAVLSFALDYWKLLAGVLTLAVVFGSGYGCRVQQESDEIRTVTDTVTVDRQIVRRDTVTETVPETVIRYVRDTVHVRDTIVTAPTGLTEFYLMPPSAVDIDGQKVTVSYYNSEQTRWQQNIYETEPPSWGYALTAGGLYEPVAEDYITEITARLSYNRMGLEATAGHVWGQDPFFAAGITYDIITR